MALEARYGLPREQVVLSCSHTHCGPVVGTNLITMYPLDEVQRARIADYARFLKATTLDVVDKAIGQLDDASLDWGNGRCDFAVNRRNNPEKDVPALRTRLALAGPVDHDVPVLRIRSLDRTVRAIVFGYACHCTVLDYYKFCGDYAGFAAIDLERDFPDCQAMFVAGCGGDQNPIPRRELKLAEDYGRQLAAAVGRVAAGPMRPIQGPLRTAYQEIDLAFGTLAHPRADRGRHEIDQLRDCQPGQASAWQDRGTRQACRRLSLSRAGLGAGRADLGIPGRRGHGGLLAPDQAQPGRLAHLGLRLLQRCDGLHPLAPRA